MIPGFEKIVEERIKSAQKEGAFDNLAGSGKPLVFEDDCQVPDDCRLAYKILKNAGFLPPEIELKKKITQAELLLEATDAASVQHREIKKKINFLLTKLDTLRGGISPLLTDTYRENIIRKLS
ncbi:MAG TPA: DnaJ family domain-containing protein [Desulfotignum sp.]|nr:DnaJ family domain-containing protein [Desulfotignum sp.]